VNLLKVLIVYDSRTGNTEEMAYAVSKAIEENGMEPVLKKVDEASVDELPNVKALILGSPVYYGLPTGKIKTFLDESVKYHGKLTHLVGGAFCSAGGTHTGSETTILALLEAMLVHGMIVQGNPHGNHYGPAAVGSPDDKALDQCRKLAERISNLVKKLNP
jgi:NAD(P)H dehydrogenase (quinone)